MRELHYAHPDPRLRESPPVHVHALARMTGALHPYMLVSRPFGPASGSKALGVFLLRRKNGTSDF